MNDNFYDYSEIEKMSDKRPIYLMENNVTGKKAVKRTVSGEELRIYNILKNINSRHFPYVIGIYNIDGQNVVLEEYVEGFLLSDIFKYSDEKFTEDEVRIIAADMCDALGELHKKNIVYRDIKPENIILTYDGVKIVDFNISRFYKQEVCKDTEFLGTPGYAAPEQFGFKQSDTRADIYSVGVLMNKMLTGYLPVEKMYDGDLGRIIEKCIRLSPEDRYESIDVLYGAIEKINTDIAAELTAKKKDISKRNKEFCNWMYYSILYFFGTSYIHNCFDTRIGLGFDYFNQVVKPYNPVTTGGVMAYISSIPEMIILQMVIIGIFMALMTKWLKDGDTVGGIVWIGIYIIDMWWQVKAFINNSSLFVANSGIMWRDIVNVAMHLGCIAIIVYMIFNIKIMQYLDRRIKVLLEK